MEVIKIKGGNSFFLKDSPKEETIEIKKTEKIAIVNKYFKKIKPKILIKINDEIIKGQELFFDKNNPNIKFISTENGIISNIIFGERKKLERIEIKIKENNKFIEFTKIKDEEIETIDNKIVVKDLINSGLFKYIVSFPDFEEIKEINENKKIIKNFYLSLFENQPLLENDINYILEKENNLTLLIKGLKIIQKISENIVVFYNENNKRIENIIEKIQKEIKNIKIKKIENIYPSSNFKLQYLYNNNKILNNKKTECNSICYYKLIETGFLFEYGKILNTKYYSISGSGAENKKYVKAPFGINIKEIINEVKQKPNSTIITGGLFIGEKIEENDFLDHETINIQIIKKEEKKIPFTFIRFQNQYLTKTKAWTNNLIKKEKIYEAIDDQNGEQRSCIQCNFCNDICPAKIFPSLLAKASIIKDIEKMESLNIYNCVECGLCTFICPSKIEICRLIKNGKILIKNIG